MTPSRGSEKQPAGNPMQLAEENARSKARGASLPADASSDCFVLGADTIVVLDERIMGKPVSREHAALMLVDLSGRTHEVITGVVVTLRRRGMVMEAVDSAVTAVRFRNISAREIDAYLSGNEWQDKAGGYGIQGLAALLVDGIEGEYSNVVGLPLSLTSELFSAHGFDLLAAEWTTVPNEGEAGSCRKRTQGV